MKEQERIVDLLHTQRSFFESLKIGDIYGKSRDSYKRIPITKEQYERWASLETPSIEQERLEFAKAHGMRDIGLLGTLDGHHIEESSFEHLAYWFPHLAERETILKLAWALSDHGKPKILDVGCGSGFLTELLAFDSLAELTGVDPNREMLKTPSLPALLPDSKTIKADIWDVISAVGPRYNGGYGARRDELLRVIQERTVNDPVFDCVDSFSFQFGNPYALNSEIQELQKIAVERETDSPIDLAICSFMPRGTDLTVAIRDGIFPKAIIYVTLDNGLAGSGSYYFRKNQTAFLWENEDGSIGDIDPEVAGVWFTPDTAVSFNPGENYRTLSQWQTVWQGNWSVFSNELSPYHEARVIVQIRKDVAPKSFSTLSLREFPFDRELIDGLSGSSVEFLENIARANSEISESGRMNLSDGH